MAAPVYQGKGGGRWWGGVIPPFTRPTVPCGHAGVPPPPAECAAAGSHAKAPAGSRGNVGGAGREGGGAQEGMREGRGGREEAAGEGGTGDGGGSRGNRGAGKGAGHPGERTGAGSRGAAPRVGGYLEEAQESREGRADAGGARDRAQAT